MHWYVGYGADRKLLLFFSYLVNDFAVASIAYVTVKGCPSVLWKSNTLPVNTNDPVLIGELVILTGVIHYLSHSIIDKYAKVVELANKIAAEIQRLKKIALQGAAAIQTFLRFKNGKTECIVYYTSIRSHSV